MKRADEFKVALHPEVQKLAGFVLSSTADLRNWIEARANIAPTFKTAYQKLADGLKGQPSEIAVRTGLLKVANAIAVLDEKSGIDKHYDRKLPDPLRTVFNSTKLASEMLDLGGKQVALAKIAALPSSFWEDLGGKELADELTNNPTKLATIVSTLPLDLKRTICGQLRVR